MTGFVLWSPKPIPVSRDTLNLALSVLTVFLGGGAVQLIVFLLRRRGELRKLDTESAVNTANAANTQQDAANKLITQLQQDGETYRGIVREVQTEMDRLRKDTADQLQIAHEENDRLTARVATLQLDLDVARRQVRDLTERWPHTPDDPLTGRYP